MYLIQDTVQNVLDYTLVHVSFTCIEDEHKSADWLGRRVTPGSDERGPQETGFSRVSIHAVGEYVFDLCHMCGCKLSLAICSQPNKRCCLVNTRIRPTLDRLTQNTNQLKSVALEFGCLHARARKGKEKIKKEEKRKIRRISSLRALATAHYGGVTVRTGARPTALSLDGRGPSGQSPTRSSQARCHV